MSDVSRVIAEAIREEVHNILANENAREPRLLAEKDVLAWLNIEDRRTLKKWVKDGLRVYQPYPNHRFYDPQDVDDFIREKGEVI